MTMMHKRNFDLIVNRSFEHIDKSAYVDLIEINRLFDGTRHRTECGLVAYIVDTFAGLLAGLGIAYIPSMNSKAG